MAEELPPAPAWDGPLDTEKRPHGQGVMTYPPQPTPEDSEDEPLPGDSYVGTMERGLRHGWGKYTWGASGAVFEGQYVANRRQGEGSMTFPDKSTYEGSFVCDRLEGQGVYHYANGDIYSGSFKAGKKHGSGEMYFKAHGCVFIGVWSGGEFVEGKWVYRDGTSFTGSFEGSVPSEGKFWFSRIGLMQEGRYTKSNGWRQTA